MTTFTFLSPQEARTGGGFEPRLSSPLARALEHAAMLHDLSLVPKLEVRGELDAVDFPSGVEVIRITSRRALVLCTADRAASARAELQSQLRSVTDMTGALAGLELEGVQLMRRLTELDLDELPAIGSILRGTPALIERRGGERFRLYVPQELGHYVAETVVDLAKGLGR